MQIFLFALVKRDTVRHDDIASTLEGPIRVVLDRYLPVTKLAILSFGSPNGRSSNIRLA